MISRFAWSDATSIEEASIILIGVPSDEGSRATRKGAFLGPDAIRRISQEREIFGLNRPAVAMSGPTVHKLWDFGNVIKKDVKNTIRNFLMKRKFPVVLGGDHSITTQVIRGFPRDIEISLIYFDAHPDIVYSTRPYYGSVVADVARINVNLKKSVEIGIRQPEIEEIRALKQKNILTITPFDIMELGMKNALERVYGRIGKHVYISVDMDVFDPAFAPGVSTPSPGGLSSKEVIYFLKKLARRGLIGFDVMETNPAYDFQDLTSHLAARLVIETIAELNVINVY
ncbi:MAG: arginase family protein [Promethearchaeota archaeon]